MYSTLLDAFFVTHALIAAGQAERLVQSPNDIHGERLDRGHEAWRATKAAFWAGEFLQGGGKSEPRPTQTASTLGFVKCSQALSSQGNYTLWWSRKATPCEDMVAKTERVIEMQN